MQGQKLRSKTKTKIRRAFCCGDCGRDYGDAMYTGPSGHAPENLCLDCWSWQWQQMLLQMRRGKNWTDIDTAIALLCRGYSYSQVGEIIGRSRRTLHNWITAIRQGRLAVPRWVEILWEKHNQKQHSIRRDSI